MWEKSDGGTDEEREREDGKTMAFEFWHSFYDVSPLPLPGRGMHELSDNAKLLYCPFWEEATELETKARRNLHYFLKLNKIPSFYSNGGRTISSGINLSSIDDIRPLLPPHPPSRSTPVSINSVMKLIDFESWFRSRSDFLSHRTTSMDHDDAVISGIELFRAF